MKRLTDKHRDLCLSCELCIDDECDHLNHSELCSNAKRYKRLADIEDILGDDYDLDRLRKLVQADRDDDLNLETDRPRIDFVDRAEKELQKAANDLEQAARRGAPKSDIFNLQRKVEYKQYVLGLLKGR